MSRSQSVAPRFISVSAPSNIALVKYMGKSDASLNLPANESLSLTLRDLCTRVELRTDRSTGGIEWDTALPESTQTAASFYSTSLDKKERDRLNRHVQRVIVQGSELLSRFGMRATGEKEQVQPAWTFRTANTFPASSGIASSASSFAGITAAVLFAIVDERDRELLQRKWNHDRELMMAVAGLSRQGSGSSGRSFFGPWVHWAGDRIEPVDTSREMSEYGDLVLVVSTEKKSVSSSSAHTRVRTSPLWQGRAERANVRAQQLRQGLAEKPTPSVMLADLVWDECWEMHSLFHTSAPPFTYWVPATLEILRWVDESGFRAEGGMVTLDAGPNPHLVGPLKLLAAWRPKIAARFPQVTILADRAGDGVTIQEVRTLKSEGA